MFIQRLVDAKWTTAKWTVRKGDVKSHHCGCAHSCIKNYTSVDPKQFTVSKFRLKPVILISEYFCSTCGHNGRQPETMGDNGRQRETRPLQSPRRRPHQPTPTPHIKGDNRRQWETTGDKTTSEPKKPTTPTNTKAARSKVALRTLTVNCLGNYQNTVCKIRGDLTIPTHCKENLT